MARSGFPPLVALIAALLGPACNHPARTITPVPGADPRNFSWAVDTISSPAGAVVMKSIWGSSTSDVYVVGHADPPGHAMYHYDGSRWQGVPLTVPEGGKITGVIGLAQVFGFISTDIVAVGAKAGLSLVIHFDGNSWSEMGVPAGGALNAVWGMYNGEMWAAGAPGTIYHYIGLAWQNEIFPDSVTFSSLSGIAEDNVYGLSTGRGPGGRDTAFHALWHWNGGVWSMADTLSHVAGRQDRFGTRSVWSLLAVVYTAGDGLYRKDQSAWDVLVPPSGSGLINAVGGTVNSALFAVGDGSAAYQVSPSDFFKYPAFTGPSVNYTGVWTNGREAFIVGSDGVKTYILRGK
ncbi:MAG TPA: hypothetical protein VMF59_02585 [Bacteroidota bacterium]|nr:hypothetical protein [Bacteroidota bacterium]